MANRLIALALIAKILIFQRIFYFPALVLLIYLAYRGISVVIVAPLMASLAVLLEGDIMILGAYTQVFMQATGNFIILYFPLFPSAGGHFWQTHGRQRLRPGHRPVGGGQIWPPTLPQT